MIHNSYLELLKKDIIILMVKVVCVADLLFKCKNIIITPLSTKDKLIRKST